MTLRTALLALALLAAGAHPARAVPPDWWQIHLSDDTYLYELKLLELRGDTLLVTQADTVVRVLLDDIDELRWIRPTEIRLGARGGVAGSQSSLSGSDDEVYRLPLISPEERRRTVAQLVHDHGVKRAKTGP
jgi:hypothetical protein